MNQYRVTDQWPVITGLLAFTGYMLTAVICLAVSGI